MPIFFRSLDWRRKLSADLGGIVLSNSTGTLVMHMSQKTTATTATPAMLEIRKNPAWPYLAALAIALSVRPKLAPINADAFVVRSRRLAYMPNVERRSGVKTVREFGRLMTSSLDEDFQFIVGKKALEIMKTPDNDACKGLSDWVDNRISPNHRKLFDQAFSQFKKGYTDLLN